MAKRLPGGRTKRPARPATRGHAAPRPSAEAPPATPPVVEHATSADAAERRVLERVPPTRPSSRPTAPRSRAALNPIVVDDRYVVADLKRIGILAAGAFAILGALAFIIK